jgi:hypothetical protein
MEINEKYKSLIGKFLPVPTPNNESLLIGLPSGTLAHGAAFWATTFGNGTNFFYLLI